MNFYEIFNSLLSTSEHLFGFYNFLKKIGSLTFLKCREAAFLALFKKVCLKKR